MHAEAAWSFQSSLHLHFHLTRSLILYILLYRNRLHSQRPPPFFLQSTGLQPSLTWIERYEDERIGCTETIAVGERFLARGWTCPRNALQGMGMELLWGGARQQVMREYLLAFLVTAACHLRGCMSPQWLIYQSNIRGLPHSSYSLLSCSLPLLPQLRHVWFLLIRSAVLLTSQPSNSNTRPAKDTLTSRPVTFLPGNYFHTRAEKVSQRFPPSVWHSLSQRCSSPSQWRLNMNTHMNIWITEQVVIVIHLHALCRACKVFCLEPVVLLSMGFLTERLKVGQRGVGAQVLLSGSFTEKEWPVSANAPSVCLLSLLLCPCALFLHWLPCWHKDLPFAQMVDSRGPPPHFLCQWSAAPLSVSEMQLWPICPPKKNDWSTEMGICTV